MKNISHIKSLITGSIDGTQAVYAMENLFNKYFHNTFHALGVCNATMGIMAILMGLKKKKGDKFITTPFTWGGTVAAALFLGMKPVFADIDPDTLTLSPDSVETALKMHKDVQLIIDVDIFGNPSLADKIDGLAHKHNCFHLVDSAGGFGAMYKGKPTGYFADAVVHSFSEFKPLNAGEGAVLMIKNERLWEEVIWLTQHPIRSRRDIPHMPPNQFALNFRIHPFAAALIVKNFEKCLDEISQKRTMIANFNKNLKWEKSLLMAQQTPEYLPSYSRICLSCPPSDKCRIVKVLKTSKKAEMIPLPSVNIFLPDDAVFNALLPGGRLCQGPTLKTACEKKECIIEINLKN